MLVQQAFSARVAFALGLLWVSSLVPAVNSRGYPNGAFLLLLVGRVGFHPKRQCGGTGMLCNAIGCCRGDCVTVRRTGFGLE